MVQEISSLLSRQVRRSTESGATDEAMARMRRYLELEREIKKSAIHRASDGFSNVRKLPVMKAV